MSPKQRDDVLVLGGSLTRSPEGRLQTLQTHQQYPTPIVVQQVWSNASRKRYPDAWEGQPLAEVGFVIEWEPRRIACVCGHALGDYVAYRTLRASGGQQRLEEHGVVEDTAKRYGHTPQRMRDGSRNDRANPRFGLTGEVGLRARKTTAIFRCRGCGKTHERNLHKLGQQLFDGSDGVAFVLS